jgi:hypothetical protein
MKKLVLIGVVVLVMSCSLVTAGTDTPAPATETPASVPPTATPEEAASTPTETLLPQVPTVTTGPDELTAILVGFSSGGGTSASGLLLGGSRGESWLSAEEIDYPEGSPFWLYTADGFIGMASGGLPYPASVQCPGVRYADMSPAPAGGQEVIALGGGWDAMPRPVEFLPTDRPEDIQQIRDHLYTNGLNSSPVELQQVLRADLLGDGGPETLLVASHFQVAGFPDIRAGDYTIVFLLKQDGGIAPLVANYHTEDFAPAAANRYRILAVLDLNGDGTMEVLVRGNRYEGESDLVFTFDGESANPVLLQDCGGYQPKIAPPAP